MSIRQDFPILARQSRGKSLVYLDNGATTQKPQIVIDAIDKYYQQHNSNVHRAAHELAEEATQMMESGRSLCQEFINAASRKEIIFTRGTTEAINLVANVLTQRIRPGQDILITELEHHSNYVPWHFLRKKKGAIIKFAQVNINGEIEIDEIKKLITNKTKIIAITHLSNVTGAIVPIKKIVDLVKSKNIAVLVDGTQGAPHLQIDMQELGCDFYAISCHKMYGPNGLGILYIKKKWKK